MTKKKLRVGVFTHDFFPIFGGQGRHIYELYKENQLQQDITMLIFSPAENDLPNHIRLFPKTKNGFMKNVAYSLNLHTVFEKLIEQYDLDIVHIHGGPGGLFIFKRLSVPTLYTTHHTYWQQFNYISSQRWKYLFYLMEKKSYSLADHIICVSTDTQDVLETYYKLSNLTYIPNGISQKIITKKKKNTKPKDLLYVGRIDKRKGLDYLLRAMTLVNDIDEKIHLHIVGTGTDKTALETFSKRNKLSTTFYDYLPDDDLKRLYDKVSIQIVPSIFEGFGISVLEGMAQGIPIIATNVDGIKSIIKHHHSGMLVPYGDEKTLAQTIVHLLDNSLLRQALITNAYKELEHYKWKDIYKTTIQTYETILT